MASSRYEIIVDTQYKGKGAKQAAKDMGGLSLKTEVAAQKTAILEKEWKDLARQVASGSKSLASAEREADKLTKEMNKLSRATDSAGGSVEKNARSLGDYAGKAAIAGAAVLAVGVAAKQAYDFIGAGAELTAAQERFDNLSVSINTTGDALLGKMKVATKGLVSDANLVSAGADIMNLGLAKTEAGVVRMAAAVGFLNLDMSVLALTLSNDSVLRLDNLGLAMENVKRTQKELQASGFIGDAFDEAVLIELEKKMVLLGDASETTAGKMKIIEASLLNVADQAKIMGVNIAAVPIAEFSSDLDTFIKEAGEASKAMTTLGKATGLTAFSQSKGVTFVQEYTKMLNPLAIGLKVSGVWWDKVTEAVTFYNDVQGKATREAEAADTVMLAYAMTQQEVEERTQLATDAINEERQAFIDSRPVVTALTGTTGELNDKMRQSASVLDATGVAAAQLSRDQRDAAAATVAHATAAAELLAQATTAPSILDTYAAALDQSGEAAQTAAGRQDVYRQNVQDLAANVDIAASRAENYAMKLLGIPPSVSTSVDIDFGDAFGQINKITRLIGSLGAARAIGGEGDDVFAGNSSVNAGGPGGFQGQTAGGGFAGGSSGTLSTPQLLGDADFDPLGPGFAHGVNKFMVPSGFPNDSFPIRVSSREEVTVRTPQQQQSGGGGGNTFNFYGMDLADVRNLLQQEGISADSRRRMN